MSVLTTATATPPTPPAPDDAGLWHRLRRRWSAVPRRTRLWIAVPLLALVAGAAGGMGFAAVIHMPKVQSLTGFQPGLITRIYDREGGQFSSFARERRVMLEEGEVSGHLLKAILAAEDSNFLQHGGVDAEGVLRAVIQNSLRGRRAMGGSTITMQLARMLFLTTEKSWRRKIEEAFLAVELEKSFSKQQILTLYCNLVFLGHGNFGMEMAARDYFGKSVGDLTLTEAATLAGLPQRPSSYSPYRRPDLVVNRRNYVLRRMLEEGFISEVEYEVAIEEPLVVRREKVQRAVAPYFAEEVRKDLEARYGNDAVVDRGLRVETTLDPRIQEAAESALRGGLLRLDHGKGFRGPIARIEGEDLEAYQLPAWDRLDLSPEVWNQGLVTAADARRALVRIGESSYELRAEGIEWTRRQRPDSILEPGDVAWFRLEPVEDDAEAPPVLHLEQEPELEGAVLVVESATGAVRGMVGGWSFKRSKFNRATQARRQLGSAFKPFVLGAAFEMGYTAADTLFDAPVGFPAVGDQPAYSPRNYYRKYYGILTLRRAIEESVNVSFVKLIDLISPQRAVDFAHRAGIESELPPYPSLALGAADLVPLEVAAAYAAVANQGVYVEPYLIERVTEADGRQLEKHRPRAHRAMSAEIAYVLTHALEGVIDRGTGKSIQHLDIDLAGKTGTTDDYSDAWFVGFAPRYTLLTWVGYDVKRSIGRNMTGAAAALPIWQQLVESGLEDGWLQPGERFVPPPGVTFQPVERRSGFLAAPGAATVVEEAFVEGTQPVLRYDPEWAMILELPWYQQLPHYLPKAGELMPDDFEEWDSVLEGWEEEKRAAR